MQNAVETAARIAAAAGAKVTELTLPPILEDAYEAQFTIQDYENVRALAFEYDRHRDRIDNRCCAITSTAALAITADEYDAARRTASRGAAGARRRHGGLRRDPHAVGARRRAARV